MHLVCVRVRPGMNLSTEFSNLIVGQRAFEANSKTVTTFDTIPKDMIAMSR
jgi:flagellar hook protein FlgE